MYLQSYKFGDKGFSLLELLIYIAILAIITMVIAGVFISVNKGRGAAEARSEVNSNLRFAVEKISQDLRTATSSASIIQPSGTSAPAAVLTFVNASGTVSYATTTDNRLKRTFNSVDEIITSDAVKIDSISFRKFENLNSVFGSAAAFASVEININISYRSDSPDWQYSANKKTTVGIRN